MNLGVDQHVFILAMPSVAPASCFPSPKVPGIAKHIVCASPNSAKQLHLVLRGLLEYATHICIEPFLIFSHSCVYLFTIYAVVMLVTSLLCNNFGKGYVHCPPSYVDITCLHFQNSERARIEAGPGERC
jgi:hypothetical protein